MAFDAKVFRTRAITAVVYAAVMLTGLLWNQWSFFLLFTVVHFGCWHEYDKLANLIHPPLEPNGKLLKLFFTFMGWGLMMMASAGSLSLFGLSLVEVGIWVSRLSIIGLALALLLKRTYGRKQLMSYLRGFVYLSVSFALLINLRSGWIWPFGLTTGSFWGKWIVMLMVASIWINDTMAYVVGSFIGKTPLSSWSPKKTWEGTIGGIVLSVLVVAVIAYFVANVTLQILLVSAVAAVAGTIGDLVESKLKRLAGVKDSGTFLPGHGGFLDRFDSIIFASPFVWLLCYMLEQYSHR